jgi:hypothetical protein
MRIEYEPDQSLPPLSWCVRASPGSPVRVRHGADVETRSEGFVEGAWDGDFEEFDFDRAETLAGSGARLRDDKLVLATPFHPMEQLFGYRRGSDLLVSNSLVFLLVEADDTLDLAHPGYFFDWIAMIRSGIAGPPARIPTASGTGVELFRVCNLTLGPDASLHRSAKPLGPPPGCYADYFGFLDRTMKQIARNALASGRENTYRLVAACSTGYDSTATAALASHAGCKVGVTFATSTKRSGHPLTGLTESVHEDSGANSLRALGMKAFVYQRAGLCRRPGFVTAEFFINRPLMNTDANMLEMEPTLRGSVFVSGRHGERFWGPSGRCRIKHFREVDDVHINGHALGEFRLRAGFLHFPICYAGALHGPAIHRITHSAEMLPWNLGTGYYNRPIARRIAEEAGVPRENFGHQNLGGHIETERHLNPESERDFQNFLRLEVPEHILRRLNPDSPFNFTRRHRRMVYIRTHYSHFPLAPTLLNLLGADRFHQMWNSTRLYEFHWGFLQLRTRYGRSAPHPTRS